MSDVLGYLTFCFVLSSKAASESGRPPEPAEELPSATAPVRLLRIRPEAVEGLHEGQT